MSRLNIRKPTRSFDASTVKTIAGAVNSVRGAVEAHLTQWFDPTQLTRAVEVLVLVLDDDYPAHQAVQSIERLLEKALPEGPSFLVIPMYRRDPLLRAVRRCKYEIYPSCYEPSPKSKKLFFR